MKNNKIAAVGVLGCAAFLAATPVKAGTPMAPVAPAPAPAPAIGAEVSVGYDTKYIFRGFDFGDNLVWGGVDLGVPLTDALSLNLGSWYGTIADDPYDELNLLAGLSYDLGGVELGLGAIWSCSRREPVGAELELTMHSSLAPALVSPPVSSTSVSATTTTSKLTAATSSSERSRRSSSATASALCQVRRSATATTTTASAVSTQSV